MANMMALMMHCKEKGDAAIIGDMTHLYSREKGNMASTSIAYPIPIRNQEDGTIDHKDIEFFCKITDPHLVVNKVFCLESSHN